MILIIGLGNPGEDYEQTRHNIGFVILDKFSEDTGILSQISKFNSILIKSKYAGKALLCVKPCTFMNNSGSAVLKVIRHFEDDIESTIVIHDDLDIEFGEIKFKSGGGTGGHNGLESILKKLGRSDFDRLRFGIGRPPGRKDPADFVLSKFKMKETRELDSIIPISIEALKDYIENGINFAMNKYN
ncbi:MAG: aminoacyl-tRNA hydrolase [Actinobacteria bacterium]|nr:aminoacyl-tRNA hydrolase [Actinomycetota bacterium]